MAGIDGISIWQYVILQLINSYQDFSMSELFQDFVSDPRVNKVIEALKRSNDIFDIISPLENQHSQILAWLFNPREGHGQGDAIFKDFLTAAYAGSYDNILSNKDFFATWTPSRIARTGFHSLTAKREFPLSNGGRLDLLMIDTVNKILVVVENKHGTRLRKKQLENYYEEVSSLRKRPAFNKYSTAHIVLDRNYGGPTGDSDESKGPRNRWTFLDYQWLEAGAHRAEVQYKRGNQSAALVIAYCQKQSDYVAPEEKQIDEILADVARDYRPVIYELADALNTELGELTKGEIDGKFGELWIYANQYPDLIHRIHAKEELSFIESRLKNNLPNRKLSVLYGKNSFWVYNDRWECFNGEDTEILPLAVHAWRSEDNETEEKKFSVGIQYRPLQLDDEYETRVQEALEKEFPELKKGRQNAAFRMLGKVQDVKESMLATKTQEVYLRLEAAMAPLLADL